MAHVLPAELHYLILSYLDPFSLHVSRRVNKAWYDGSADSVLLRRLLQQLCGSRCTLGDSPAHSTSHDSEIAIQWLRASAALMFDASMQVSHQSPPPFTKQLRNRKIALSPDMLRTVALDARVLTLYASTTDGLHSTEPPRILSQCLLNDLRSPHHTGPVLRNAPSCVFELAIAEHTNMVAVALDRTIQIYNLDDPTALPASAYISAAAGHFISGLDFAFNDRLLRVRLSNKGAVLYLGTPSNDIDRASLDFWRSPHGLRTVFLESTKLTTKASTLPSAPPKFTGLQLLTRTASGYLLAAQRHIAPTTDDYCLAFLPATSLSPSSNPHVSGGAVPVQVLTVLSCKHPPPTFTTSPFWSAAPLAREQMQLRFALSSDGKLLAVVEEGNIHFTPARTQSRVFVWRLPRLEFGEEEGGGADLVAGERGEGVEGGVCARLPLYLGELPGNVLTFGFGGRCGRRDGYHIGLTTTIGAKQFLLEGV